MMENKNIVIHSQENHDELTLQMKLDCDFEIPKIIGQSDDR